jgi:hypothetical protein
MLVLSNIVIFSRQLPPSIRQVGYFWDDPRITKSWVSDRMMQGGQLTRRFCVHEHTNSSLCSDVWWLYLRSLIAGWCNLVIITQPFQSLVFILFLLTCFSSVARCQCSLIHKSPFLVNHTVCHQFQWEITNVHKYLIYTMKVLLLIIVLM